MINKHGFSTKLKIITAFILINIILCTAISADNITFTADLMTGKAGNKNEATTLTGNAYVKTDSITLSSESIELSGKDFRYVTATGTVKGSYTASGLDFECTTLRYDREKEAVYLSGSVILIDKENDVRANAQVIEYDKPSDIATMQIDVRIKQKNNTCSSAYAIYKKKDQKLELNGNALVQKENDSFRAQSIKFDLESEEITMDGNVRGSVTDD